MGPYMNTGGAATRGVLEKSEGGKNYHGKRFASLSFNVGVGDVWGCSLFGSTVTACAAKLIPGGGMLRRGSLPHAFTPRYGPGRMRPRRALSDAFAAWFDDLKMP